MHSPILIEGGKLAALATDQAGFCGICGSMTHPVPAAANAGYCDVCQLPTVYGIGAAIRAGLVVLIDFGPAAVPAEVIQ